MAYTSSDDALSNQQMDILQSPAAAPTQVPEHTQKQVRKVQRYYQRSLSQLPLTQDQLPGEEESSKMRLTGADLTSRFVKNASIDGDLPRGTSTNVCLTIQGTGYSMEENVSLVGAVPEQVEVVSNCCDCIRRATGWHVVWS